MTDEIKTIQLDDPAYPELLRQSFCPPKLLYYRGSLDFPKRRILAVIGTRRMSMVGRRSGEMIIPPLARAGYTIVSGLAYGMDTVAHSTTLAAHGVTLAVLANGLDDASIYPRENLPLVHHIIASGGCVLSEFPCGTTPRKQFFPQRNRIVAGLCHGVLVIEAPEKSGALITAFRALNENREVLSVPGPITQETCGGTNLLLKLGAHVVTCAQDVLHVFGDDIRDRQEQMHLPELSPDEQRIVECVRAEALHLDEIAERTKLDIRIIHSTLGAMELKGLIQSMGNGRFIKK